MNCNGLYRVRSFTQDDAHIFCRPDQVKGEFLRVMDIIQTVFKVFSFDNFEAQISLRDPNDHEKYIGSDEVWEESETAIKEACKEKGLDARSYAERLHSMDRNLISWLRMLSVVVGSWVLFRWIITYHSVSNWNTPMKTTPRRPCDDSPCTIRFTGTFHRCAYRAYRWSFPTLAYT